MYVGREGECMVEIRYNESTGQLKLPKNIRQVGKSEGETKIYVEDYVITFLNQLAASSPMEEKLAILLGYTVEKEHKTYIFIHGAIAVNDVNIQEDHIGFTSGIWAKIYDEIKQWFGDAKVAGWFLTRPGKTIKVTDKIKKVHAEHFSGEGKTLFVVDPLDKEEAFFIYHKGQLQRQGGYYIYYERNEEMQNYMIEFAKSQEEQDLMNKVIVENTEEIDVEEGADVPKKRDYNVLAKRLTGYAAVFLVLVVAVSAVTLVSRNRGTGQVMTKTGETVESVAPINEPQGESTTVPQESVVDVISQGVETESQEEDFVSGWSNPESDQSEVLVNGETEQAVSVMTTAINGTKYTVSSGDTLAGISSRFYNSLAYIDSICILNDIDDPDTIYEGMTIILP